MLIQGFENAPLVAGEELLELPGFWAAYLMWLSETQEYDPVPEWFGVDGADAAEAWEALSDEDRWPVFRIPFAGGHTASVLGCNLRDDPGTEYLITHPQWGRHGHLATLGGHQAGPGLSWSGEATPAARRDLSVLSRSNVGWRQGGLLPPPVRQRGGLRGCAHTPPLRRPRCAPAQPHGRQP